MNDLEPPDHLDEQAAAFWRQHAEQLVQNQLLTASTADSFATMAELWSLSRHLQPNADRNPRPYLDTLKAFQSLAKLFRLVPNEKPQIKESHYADFGEIEV